MSEKTNWSRELIISLLTEYEQREHLYNLKHKDYLNRNMRESSLEDIYNKLKSINSTITLSAIRSKIQILRSQFSKELRLVAASKKSGSGIEDIYEPKLWCFKQLNFLQPHCTIKPSVSNINEDLDNFDDVNLSSSSNDQAENTICSTPKRKNCFSKLDLRKQVCENLTLTKNLLQNRNCGGDDWVGQLVLSQLKHIKNPIIRNNTIWDIQCALRKGIEEDSATITNVTSRFKRSDDENLENVDLANDSISNQDNARKFKKIDILSVLKMPPSPSLNETLMSPPHKEQQSIDDIIDEDENFQCENYGFWYEH